jgi:hypothetical protein
VLKRGIVVGCALLAGLAGGSAAPAAASTVVEGEALSWPAGTGEVRTDDPSASDGKYRKQWSEATASATVTTTENATYVSVRARGDQCDGAPHMTVSIDGQQIVSADVANAAAWADYGDGLYAPAGTHTVAVAYTNDHTGATPLSNCDRNLHVDKVTIEGQPLSPTSYRNQPLADSAPIAANSQDLVSELVRIAAPTADGGYGNTWIGTDDVDVPTVYTVSADQPTREVVLDDPNSEPELVQPFKAVPIPDDVQTYQRKQNGWDSPFIIWQPSTNKMWELYSLHPLGPLDSNHDAYLRGVKWGATGGGYMDNVSTNPGRWPYGHGGAASRIPYIAGLPRMAEVRALRIDHPVSFVIPRPALKPTCTWPAGDTDGWYSGPGAVPEGTRFRLPPTLNVDAIAGLSAYGKAVAHAVQRYGMILTDSDGTPNDPQVYALGFSVERQHDISKPDVYFGPGGLISESTAWQARTDVFRYFPFDKLQVVAPPSPAPWTCPDPG